MKLNPSNNEGLLYFKIVIVETYQENLASEKSEGKKTLMLSSSSFSFQQLDNFWLEKEEEVEEEEVCCQSYKT